MDISLAGTMRQIFGIDLTRGQVREDELRGEEFGWSLQGNTP